MAVTVHYHRVNGCDDTGKTGGVVVIQWVRIGSTVGYSPVTLRSR
jgi:hypothetical protein